MRGALMVCGTASDVGKSQIVAGLCRLLARQGVRVAPFKAQNMALNSFVTPGGHEIGRAQAMQAMAAGVEPDVTMNPILLKPTGERTSQVVVMGRPWQTLDAVAYHHAKPELRGVVIDALADLRSRYDVILLEGAGSPAEINLLDHDLVNLGLASAVGIPAIVVGDIDRGGVFAALYGTVALLPDDLRRWVRGFVINKFRGDPALLEGGVEDLQGRCGVPTFGVLPFAEGLTLDAEDSLALSLSRTARHGGRPGSIGEPATLPGRDPLDVAVIRFPRISNFTDVDALAIEPGVAVRFVDSIDSLGDPDLVVLPGTKSTVDDLAWFRKVGFDHALDRLRLDDNGDVRPDSPLVLGICGGYQMLGTRIEDPGSVETREGTVQGLELLDLRTVFLVDKRTRQRRGRTSWRQSASQRSAGLRRGTTPDGRVAAISPEDDWELEGSPRQAPFLSVTGYEIHHGRPYPGPSAVPWILLGDARGKRNEGIVDDRNGVLGTSLHGLLEGDELRSAVLGAAAERRGRTWEPSGISFAGARQGQINRLADLCRDHLDLDALWQLVIEGGGTTPDAAGVTAR
jgi:adenosylcobyric acid synthase